MHDSPAFGEADLSNCERELIHLAGSVQPHGVLLALDASRTVLQATLNAESLLGVPAAALLGGPLRRLDAALDDAVARVWAADGGEPAPLQCALPVRGRRLRFEGSTHRNADGVGIVELEPVDGAAVEPVTLPADELLRQVTAAVERLSAAATLPALADAVVRCVRELTGYDRVMVYRFDPDGHGKVIAESRHPRLEPLLGHHYPASDIPQRARQLYLRNRVRVLVDVHYTPSPLQPRLLPTTGAELDMSLAYLRSMSPLHLQYLKNMGVTATLVASLVREGRLWGLIACHHYAPRNLRLALRAACGMLAEVASTRIAGIEHYAHAQVAMLVRRLEQRLIEATSAEGDWRLALLRSPRHLLQPLEASGAVLAYDGEILTAGEVPSTPELRALLDWVAAQPFDGGVFACSSVARANAALQALTPTASGVLAARLSQGRPDFLLWLRKEQLQSVTWAGDPTKPALVSDDPLTLSPRRSFAAWSEIVRGTALPWSGAELALARAIGASLVDIILQVQTVRLLIGSHQLARVRQAIDASSEPVLIADAADRLLFCNAAFALLAGRECGPQGSLESAAALFTEPQALRAALAAVRERRQPWSGELALVRPQGDALPVAVRIDCVHDADGTLLGSMLIVVDLTERKRALAARRQLESSLQLVPLAPGAAAGDEVLRALVANASMAAMDVADGGADVAPLLQEIEAATKRAAGLYEELRRLAASG